MDRAVESESQWIDAGHLLPVKQKPMRTAREKKQIKIAHTHMAPGIAWGFHERYADLLVLEMQTWLLLEINMENCQWIMNCPTWEFIMYLRNRELSSCKEQRVLLLHSGIPCVWYKVEVTMFSCIMSTYLCTWNVNVSSVRSLQTQMMSNWLNICNWKCWMSSFRLPLSRRILFYFIFIDSQ